MRTSGPQRLGGGGSWEGEGRGMGVLGGRGGRGGLGGWKWTSTIISGVRGCVATSLLSALETLIQQALQCHVASALWGPCCGRGCVVTLLLFTIGRFHMWPSVGQIHFGAFPAESR